MNVTSMVTRNSEILPLLTAAFCSTTCKPVIPRSVLLARSRPSRTAASKLCEDADVIFDTLATAIAATLGPAGFFGRQGNDTLPRRTTASTTTPVPSHKAVSGLRRRDRYGLSQLPRAGA